MEGEGKKPEGPFNSPSAPAGNNFNNKNLIEKL